MVIGDVLREYRAIGRRGRMIIMGLALATLAVALVSVSASEVRIGVLEAFRILYDHICGIEPATFKEILKDRIVCEQNIPRAIGAVLAGATLAVCGAMLQNLIRNPLADPYTLGISSGAMFGMVLCVGLGISVVPFIPTGDAQIVNAFVMALIPTAVVILISMFKKVTPTMMILCGIAVMYVFSAMTTLIKYSVESETLSMIYQWSIGSVSGLSWGAMPKMLAAFLVVVIPAYLLRSQIDLVAQGDNNAITLGVDPNRLRMMCLVIVSVGTAIIVCYTGTIGFVGLVAPHMARMMVGSKCRLLIPCSAAVGALMMISADYAVRIIAPSLPVGVIIALVCSPIFIYILVRMRKNAW